jgi:hypothetical protein
MNSHAKRQYERLQMRFASLQESLFQSESEGIRDKKCIERLRNELNAIKGGESSSCVHE